jgi:hypothetical protein
MALHVSARHNICPTTGAGITPATGTEPITSGKTFVAGIGLVHVPAMEANNA